MKKVINISIIILFLITACLIEQLLSQSYFSGLNERVKYIREIVSATDDLNSNEIPYYTDEIYSYWTEKESVLCTFINHNDIDDIGIEINKMRTNVGINDKDKYLENLNLVKFYITSYQHLIGINLQNIF